MEQVFDLVNVVLRNDRQTIRRKLRIKGYKVIPLASQAGVIEFVENTRPLKDWLEAAHSRCVMNWHRQMVLIADNFTRRLGIGQQIYLTQNFSSNSAKPTRLRGRVTA